MNNEWQLQDAKSKLSQLIKRATAGAAQVVTVHGTPTAVVISAEEYGRLTRRLDSLSSALLRPDLAIEDLDLSRCTDTGRDISL